ncbi:MAG TPA: ABC transporter substrate-binding protein [Anaerolineales bacterium]|nr:ABC transporter substrate-binding protein [Anaerolineales bacterium]
MQSNKVAKTVWALLTWAIIATLVVSGCGAQKPKVYHVGLMSYGKAFTAVGDGIKEKMTELGYIEGQNIVYETRIADEAADDAEELRLAKELVDAKVDVIVAFPSPSVVAAIEATKGTDIPVVFVYYPIEGNALIKSVREPGGNVTGVRYPGPELMTRRMQLLHAIAPQVKRVWIGYNATGPNTAVALDALRPAAAEAGITLVEVPAAKIEELAADLAARDASDELGIDAIFLMPDSFNTSTDGFAMLSKFATEHNLPLVGSLANMVDSALFVNTIDNKALGELAAPTIDKVLHGAQAGTLPVITPDQTLIINNKVAQQLGLTVPEIVLEQANKIIK